MGVNINQSATLNNYKDTMTRIMRSMYPHMTPGDIKSAIDYSIDKRLYNGTVNVYNHYTNKTIDMSILDMCDYIATREPIITSYGVLFKKHETVPNPMGKVIQSFLDLRGIHKKEMFKFPKGSEEFEHYNLLQGLDKIDANARNHTMNGARARKGQVII